jgi:Ca2+:H+ antiporter
MKKLLKPSIYWLLIFIPLSFFLEYNHASATVLFFAAALSIIPIAKGIGEATETLAGFTGPSVGALLNATFGNAPELIISIVALRAGLFDVVLASITGAILANLLLAMGVSFVLGGIKNHLQEFNVKSVRVYNSILFIAILSMALPSAFTRFTEGSADLFRNTVSVNAGISAMLLIAYFFYLFFMLKTHPDFFKGSDHEGEELKKGSITKPIVALAVASIAAAFMSELLVGAAEEAGNQLGMSTMFISLIFISIVGGAAESFSAITMARKNKLDVTMGILMGSCIQIILFIAPLLVLLSFLIAPTPMFLAFTRLEVILLLIAALVALVLTSDGSSHWFKGVQLILMYLLIAVVLYYLPHLTAK